MLLLLPCVIAALMLAGPCAPPPSVADPASLAHLPASTQQDIEAWRSRLAGAACLRVECETDETWANLHQPGPDGSPRLVAPERLRIVSWMTPDSVWMTVHAVGDAGQVQAHPVLQQYWSQEAGQVWERTREIDAEEAEARRYSCPGPDDVEAGAFGSRGCIYATTTQSWLAGPADLALRTTSVPSMAFFRRTNLAMTPPDPSQPGLWLDVFAESVPRDQDAAPESLYRRQDFMLLARDSAGRPEVREWRTLVLTDETNAGRTPQQITGIRRFRYEFAETIPAGIRAEEAFVREVDSARRDGAPGASRGD